MVAGQTPVPFGAALGLGRVRSTQFEASLDAGTDYWELESEDRVTVARGVSPDPAAAATVDMARRDIEMLDGLTEALDRGGRVLELGCGVGSRMCALMRAFPAAAGVGVELAADVAESVVVAPTSLASRGKSATWSATLRLTSPKACSIWSPGASSFFPQRAGRARWRRPVALFGQVAGSPCR